jgi:hypothetical protein
MKTITNSLNTLIDFENVEIKEGETVLAITQMPGVGVFITIDKIDYFRNHVNMHCDAWENFLFRMVYDKSYRAMHVVNKRWYGLVNS